MVTERLDLRLDRERRRKLSELAAERKMAMSEVVRLLIDDAYEHSLRARRVRAAQELARLEVEDVPDPETLSRQLEDAHDASGLH